MRTTPAPSPVKRALLEKLHQDVLPALEPLVLALPDALSDAAQAERQVRTGALAAARLLLAAWGQVADTAVDRPACPHCRLPMHHKGYKAGGAVTTLGPVRAGVLRRTRGALAEGQAVLSAHRPGAATQMRLQRGDPHRQSTEEAVSVTAPGRTQRWCDTGRRNGPGAEPDSGSEEGQGRVTTGFH